MKKKTETYKAYICGIDWECELHMHNANDVKLYSSLKKLKEERSCWKECGIVELDIKVNKWVSKQNLFRGIK